jgi:hypothetical protein
MNISKQERAVMAQFRCGILLLHIENGSYMNEPPQEHFCKLCNNGSIEDEHFSALL